VSNNTIVDFRAGVGVQVRAGNPTAGAPTGSAGTAGSPTNVIDITGNSMNGGNAGIGNQPDRFFTGGVSGNGGQGNFNVSNNGTAANRLRNIDCIAIEMQVDGPVTMTSTVQNNFINANSAVGCAGIAVGTDDPNDLGAGTHSTLISGNNVMGTDGQGIFAIVRDSASTMTARVLNNTVAAPIANAARSGIQASSGSAQGDTTLCLEITGNTTAGSTNTATGTTSPGIALRKQGTDPTINTFGIEGMTATASPGVENYVNALNTSTSGTFGVGGTTLLSAQSGFTNCTAP
jgi:large repetitive protein